MPETEQWVRPFDSFTQYSKARTRVQAAVFLRDLRENPEKWMIYTKSATYTAALAVCSRYKTGNTPFKFLDGHRDHIRLAAMVDPEQGPMVLMRWVP